MYVCVYVCVWVFFVHEDCVTSSLLLGPERSCPSSDQMARHSGSLPDPMTLNRLLGTREHTGHKISEPFLDFLPLTSAFLQRPRARGSEWHSSWTSRSACVWRQGWEGGRLLES